MVAKKQIDGRRIGQEDCRMLEVPVTDETWPEMTRALRLDHARKYRRVDMGISGTIEGYTVKEGPRTVEFTSAPDFMFPQAGNFTQPLRGIVKYESSKGSGMTLLYPENAPAWNGKLYVTVHGGGGSFREGTMKPWDQNFDPSEPMGKLSKFEKLMLEKGYAVAITRRNAEFNSPGDYSVTLDDGTILENRNTGDHTDLILGFARVAQNLLKSRLGKKPLRTYWYGKSAGARLGRLVNYEPGANTDENGKPIIDGILADDPGAGLWRPVLFRDGKDILFRTEKDRERFVKTVEITHQLYINERNDPVPESETTNFIINKWKAAKLLREKGLENKYRMYEVRGISHSGGEYLPDQEQGDVEILPLWRLMDTWIDMLDQWVEKGVEPPSTKSDWLELGDVDRNGINENEALSSPEVACPLGVYYPYPPSLGTRGVGTTGFAGFDGKSLEPLDGRSVRGKGEWYEHIGFVDMNLNGFRDYRESVTQAWRRLGLLKANETFSRDKYADCVKAAVSRLRKEHFLTEKLANFYIEEAAKAALPER
ncbi:MAG: hypothetical protein HY652_10525 [Acidobacteria bacterium]|nr:hypothetical protein [Acidobacteriota bacterium]